MKNAPSCQSHIFNKQYIPGPWELLQHFLYFYLFLLMDCPPAHPAFPACYSSWCCNPPPIWTCDSPQFHHRSTSFDSCHGPLVVSRSRFVLFPITFPSCGDPVSVRRMNERKGNKNLSLCAVHFVLLRLKNNGLPHVSNMNNISVHSCSPQSLGTHNSSLNDKYLT